MGWQKYGAKKVVIDGITFASKNEGKRYVELKIREKAGEIKNVKCQPKFPCVINEKKICTYIADFEYEEDGESVYEDVKGFRTPVFNLKLKLVQALYPDVEILLLTAR